MYNYNDLENGDNIGDNMYNDLENGDKLQIMSLHYE